METALQVIAMSADTERHTSPGKHFNRSVVDGAEMVNEYLARRLGMAEYARQMGLGSSSSDGGLIEVASVSG